MKASSPAVTASSNAAWRPAGNDADRGDQLRAAGEEQRLPAARLPHQTTQLLDRYRRGEDAGPSQHDAVEAAERLELLEPELPRHDGGVAVVGVTVEWEVIADERYLVLEQEAHALAERSGKPRRLAAPPEQAVVNEDRIGAPRRRLGEELRRRRDRGGETLDLGPPRHLQAVDARILERVRIEEIVEVGNEMVAVHAPISARGPPQGKRLQSHHVITASCRVRGRRLRAAAGAAARYQLAARRSPRGGGRLCVRREASRGGRRGGDRAGGSGAGGAGRPGGRERRSRTYRGRRHQGGRGECVRAAHRPPRRTRERPRGALPEGRPGDAGDRGADGRRHRGRRGAAEPARHGTRPGAAGRRLRGRAAAGRAPRVRDDLRDASAAALRPGQPHGGANAAPRGRVRVAGRGAREPPVRNTRCGPR